MTNTPIDYQSALDAFRKEENTPDNPVRSADSTASVYITDSIVDYEAVSRAWDKEQAGKYKIRLRAKKRNLSHDPER